MDHADIGLAETAEQVESVRALFQEYWNSFGFTPCFQNFEDEVAKLPGKYAPPDGRLLLAYADGVAAGCIALRPFDAERAEVKRLFVKPEFRGSGLGLTLLQGVIAEARRMGYRELVGDTMPVMEKALSMYDRLGFERTSSYAADGTPGAIFLRLRL